MRGSLRPPTACLKRSMPDPVVRSPAAGCGAARFRPVAPSTRSSRRPSRGRAAIRKSVRHAALPGRGLPVIEARRRPALADDARREDRPDDPGRARRTSTPTRRRSRATTSAACCRAAARCRPRTRRPRGRTWSTATSGPRSPPRLHIPILYGIDTVHGDGNMDGATVFPHNIGLGATRDPALVRDVEHVAAEETRTTGPQWAFAPCICVARDDRWGRTYESFGEDPRLVEQMETAIDGFQGAPGQLADPDRVLATAKHFAGDGLTTYGTGSNNQTTGNYPIDQGVDQVDHATFDRLALSPYVPAVRQHHVGSVMPSYSDVDWTEDGLGNRINMHANRDLITGWLKEQDGLRRVRDLRLQRHRSHQPRGRPTFAAAGRGGRQRRHRHVHAAGELRAVRGDADRPGRLGSGPDGADRRRGAPDPHQEVRARAVRAPVHRPPVHRPGRLAGAPRAGRRARRASPRCCSRTAGTCCRSAARTATSTSPARTPTTSATRPAAGR